MQHVITMIWWYTPKLNLPQVFNKDVQCQMPFIPLCDFGDTTYEQMSQSHPRIVTSCKEH
jgi:hypothetical protein